VASAQAGWASVQQELQQRLLAGGERHLGRASPCAPLGGIEAQVARGEDGGALGRSPSQQGSQPRHQNLMGERLHQIVVGAGVERHDLDALALPRGEDQDRRPDLGRPHGRTDLQTVESRQHDVEDDEVVLVLPDQPQPVDPVEREVDREALRLETLAEPGRERLLVLDHQNPHRPSSVGLWRR
jgi:hypothetical protein